MIQKLIILSCFFFLGLTQIFSADTLRYEQLKFDYIKVDTIKKTSDKKFIACSHLYFKDNKDSVIHINYIESSELKSEFDKIRPKLKKGQHFNINLSPVCISQLEDNSFYKNFSGKSYDKCSISNLFDEKKYDQFKGDISKSIYVHIEAKIYKVVRFEPVTIAEPIKKGPSLDFIPVNFAR